MCGWKNYVSPRANWQVVKPASSSVGQLPKYDADSQATGAYASVNSPSAISGQLQLMSEQIWIVSLSLKIILL